MKTTPVWFESLTDSVYALGTSAREARRAVQAAQIAHDQYDLDRLQLVNGKVHIEGRSALAYPSFRPHRHVLFNLGDIHGKHADQLRALYSNVAHGYAYGTAWAVLQVLDGQLPDAVQLGRTPDGHYTIPSELCPVPPAFPQLQRWTGYERFEQARQHLLRCDCANEYADFLDESDHLSDHEAGQLHEALDTAAGLPDAAYAYGQLAESALRFALLEPIAQYRAENTHPSH